MKIGVFHPALDMYGGAEVVAVATVNALARNGYDIVLFVNHEVDQKRVKEMIGEPLLSSKVVVRSTPLKPRGPLHLYESAFRSLIFKSHCDLLIDTYSNYIFSWIDVSYMHFPCINNYDYRPRFPYVKKPHIQNILAAPYALHEKNLRSYEGKLVFANSYFTANVIKNSLGADSKVLYPPIPNAFFAKDEDSLLSVRENLVVTVARFGIGKGVELVPQIAYQTPKNIKFVIIGLAHDLAIIEAIRQNLKKLSLDQRVTLIPNASREQIIYYLSRAKVYLHTTKMEHFGISIAEAMALGCIPVVHDSGGAPEFVPDCYRYCTSEDAARIVTKAQNNWTFAESRRMANAAQRFSESNYAKRFVQLFEDYIQVF